MSSSLTHIVVLNMTTAVTNAPYCITSHKIAHPYPMNTNTRRRIIENIRRCSTDPQALDPGKPMPHIICPEAKPHMERPASVWPPLLAGLVLGIIVGVAAVNYLSL